MMFDRFGVRFVPSFFLKEAQVSKAKPLDKHGTTLVRRVVRIAYPLDPHLGFKITFTGNLITIPRSVKNTIFSSAVHRASDIKNLRTIFETLDTRLLNALCEVNTEGKHDVRQKYSKWLWRKIPFEPEHRN